MDRWRPSESQEPPAGTGEAGQEQWDQWDRAEYVLAQLTEEANELPEQYNRQRDNHIVLGRTEAGRQLLVIWVQDVRGRYPIHALPAGRRLVKRWEKL